MGLAERCDVALSALETVVLGTQSFASTESLTLSGVNWGRARRRSPCIDDGAGEQSLADGCQDGGGTS